MTYSNLISNCNRSENHKLDTVVANPKLVQKFLDSDRDPYEVAEAIGYSLGDLKLILKVLKAVN